jgi:hypothetical protein
MFWLVHLRAPPVIERPACEAGQPPERRSGSEVTWRTSGAALAHVCHPVYKDEGRSSVGDPGLGRRVSIL